MVSCLNLKNAPPQMCGSGVFQLRKPSPVGEPFARWSFSTEFQIQSGPKAVFLVIIHHNNYHCVRQRDKFRTIISYDQKVRRFRATKKSTTIDYSTTPRLNLTRFILYCDWIQQGSLHEVIFSKIFKWWVFF